MINELVYYDEITQSLSKAVYHANANLKNAMGLLRMTLMEGMWRKRIVTMTGEVVQFTQFEEYVTAQPPEGLGTDIATLKLLCASNPELLDLIERTVNPKQIIKNPHGETKRLSRPPRFSKAWTVERLKSAGREDLIKQLKSGKSTPYKIQVEMGWRKKEIKQTDEID